MKLEGLFQGKNSVLYGSESKSVLYEKLSNTIHTGKRERLNGLQKRIEEVNYKPIFETSSLKRMQDDPLSILFLEITEQCNFRCSYCIYSENYPNERIETSKNMSFDTAKKAVDGLVPLSKNNVMIGFYGGEPLLNMGLIRQIMNYSKEKFPDKEFGFSMTTNFFNADRYIQEIVDNGMYINLSLDGPKEIHDECRRTKNGKPTYDKIMSNLRKVEEYSLGYVDSHIFILSTCDNPADIPRIIDFFDQNRYFVTHINSPDPKGRVNLEKRIPLEGSGINLSKEFMRRILNGEDPKILRRLFDQDLKSVAVRDGRVMPQELMLSGSCYPGKKRIFVDVNGNYHPCERFGHRLNIGSVEEGVQQNLVDDTIESFAKIRSELCGECWAQRICSPCLQHAKDPEGEFSLEGLSQTCEGKKSQLLIALENYTKLFQSDTQKTENYIKSINPLFERRLI